MKIFTILTTLALLGCCKIAGSTERKPECRFDFHKRPPCMQNDYQVFVQTIPLAEDEIQLQTLQVIHKSKRHLLNISIDTRMLDGDKGIISFEDINFDGIADIAVSTSFGSGNRYMDYWIFDKEKELFIKIGNYARFSLQPQKKWLSNTVKINAASYQDNIYFWRNNKLVKK